MGNCQMDLYATLADCQNSISQQFYDQTDTGLCIPPMFQWGYSTMLGCQEVLSIVIIGLLNMSLGLATLLDYLYQSLPRYFLFTLSTRDTAP
jgi:hypothetical protein